MYDRIQGVLPEPIGEGSHFRVPWLQSPNIMDIRTRPRTISSVTGTKGNLVPCTNLTRCLQKVFLPLSKFLQQTLYVSADKVS